MTGKGIGYGKTILFGEHFVVYGLPGIASAIGDYTVAEVEDGNDGLTFVDNRSAIEGYKETKKEEISRQLDAIFNFMKIDVNVTPLKISLSGNLECASGIGASAALASSIARALDEHFDLGLSNDQINEIAFEGERGGSGSPSGIDNTCSTYGGMITFEKNITGGPNKIQLLDVAKPLEIIMANTGITQETKVVVADVKTEKEKHPELYERIFTEYRRIFTEAVPAIKHGDVQKIGKLMDENQKLLREITVSCPEVEKIITTAKSSGALGAKLTGTGRGGLVICLSPERHATDKIANAIEHEGFKTSKTVIGKK